MFLDRDGTLIKSGVTREGKPAAINEPDDVQLTSGAAEFCAAMQEAGVQLFMVTNQPDVARGLVPRYTVEQINQSLANALEIAEVAVSWSDDDADPLRKPNPGLILELAARHDVDLGRSVMIGDRFGLGGQKRPRPRAMSLSGSSGAMPSPALATGD